jgi:drug/metabolite transporter (DMT)-like permease
MATRRRLAIALLAVYLIWGSTYLAIKFGIETIPPFILAGVRYLTAGLAMLWLAKRSGAPSPTRPEIRASSIAGVLMLLFGNGGVVWAEQRVPSGLAALLIAGTPLWMTLIDWLRPKGTRPPALVGAGLGMGLLGVGLLVGPGGGAGTVEPLGAVALAMASLGWSLGSIYSRHAPLPRSALMATALEMVGGGVALLLLALVTGEPSSFELAKVSLASLAALLYLIVAGSLIGFTAYAWLLRVTTPARAASYAYVNPLVAVFLGWAILDEPVTAKVALAGLVIITSVVLITVGRKS